jgi:hypothetical protein
MAPDAPPEPADGQLAGAPVEPFVVPVDAGPAALPGPVPALPLPAPALPLPALALGAPDGVPALAEPPPAEVEPDEPAPAPELEEDVPEPVELVAPPDPAEPPDPVVAPEPLVAAFEPGALPAGPAVPVAADPAPPGAAVELGDGAVGVQAGAELAPVLLGVATAFVAPPGAVAGAGAGAGAAAVDVEVDPPDPFAEVVPAPGGAAAVWLLEEDVSGLG